MWNRKKVAWAPISMWMGVVLLGCACPAFAERPKTTETPAECSSFTEAKKHLGQKSCIRGEVLRVEHSSEGMSYLNFCEDFRTCPFTVVIFAEDLHHVGGVETLVGRTIEIRGKVRDYDGRAEIVLQDAKQLGGEIRRLPPVPKEFDVEQQGKFSPGTSHASKPSTARPKKAKLQTTVDVEDGFDQ